MDDKPREPLNGFTSPSGNIDQLAGVEGLVSIAHLC